MKTITMLSLNERRCLINRDSFDHAYLSEQDNIRGSGCNQYIC